MPPPMTDVAFRDGSHTPEPEVVSVDAIPTDALGLDIGPGSAKAFAAGIADAKTVFWNGPVGVFEVAEFPAGTARSPHH